MFNVLRIFCRSGERPDGIKIDPATVPPKARVVGRAIRSYISSCTGRALYGEEGDFCGLPSHDSDAAKEGSEEEKRD